MAHFLNFGLKKDLFLVHKTACRVEMDEWKKRILVHTIENQKTKKISPTGCKTDINRNWVMMSMG